MAGPFRLQSGGQIDRAKPLQFTFDDRALTGFAGDTLASALLGAGVSVVGRGFKFHRPRGVLSAGLEEPNALVAVGTGARYQPNVRATMQPLVDGLTVQSQNRWPSLRFDVGRLNDWLHRLLPAGFYNKTFIWPSWHTFEPAIRRMAGLGHAATEPDPDRYAWRNAHCDVLVIGGGAAGLLAAVTAGRSGARVLLLESDRMLGGSLNWTRSDAGPGSPEQQVQEVTRELVATRVRVLVNTTAVGVYDHGVVAAVESAASTSAHAKKWRERWWRIRAKHIVLATGAFEQPLAFPFNNRPGIMLAEAVRHYLNRYAVAAGQRVAVVTNNDSAYRVALELHAAGITVPCLPDTRANSDTQLAREVAAVGIDLVREARIIGTAGSRRIDSLRFTSPQRSQEERRVGCDALAMSGGWNPTAHLYCQAGGRLRFDAHNACLIPDGKLKLIRDIGSAAGIFDAGAASEHARQTLDIILSELGLPPPQLPGWARHAGAPESSATGPLGYSAMTRRDRTWIDFQHDVTASDIDLAARENLVSVEHVKRYTTVGMSVDQGKTSNLNALAILAERTNRTLPEVGTTTFRPLFIPVTLGAIAGGRNGRFYRPFRRMPAHSRHEALGACLEDYGGWLRPAYYPTRDESREAAIAREVRALCTAVGIFEASPLGKFLVRGPDAAELLNRMYANTMSTLQPSKARYGLMLNEQGVVIDDGVCARLSSEEFWVNTTSGGSARIAASFDEWLQCEWTELQVVVTDVMSAFATLNVAGPRARELLESLPCDIDLSRASFPHMHVRTGQLCGVPCRILRVSFSGELSYEISVPADFGDSLWNRLCTAGRPLGITPFGVESLMVARTEKGYLHVGSDTDGVTVPDDIGFGEAVAKKKGDFIGRRSLTLPENLRCDRLQFVGLRCKGDTQAFRVGAHLLDAPLGTPPQETAGYLTLACFSPTLEMYVGLGLLRQGRARLGQTVYVADMGRHTAAEVVSPAHYDPAGARLND